MALEPQPFPILHADKIPGCPKSIPWDYLNEEWALRNHNQTTFTLARRGGLSPCEALAVIERRPWHRMDDAEAVKQLIAATTADGGSEHE